MAGRKPKQPEQKNRDATFGDLVRTQRKAMRLSGSTLGERVGVHRVTISRIENGHTTPSGELLTRIIKVLGLERVRFLDPSDAIKLLNDLRSVGDDERELFKLEMEVQMAERKRDAAQAAVDKLQAHLDYARRKTRENDAARRIVEAQYEARAQIGESVTPNDTDMLYIPDALMRAWDRELTPPQEAPPYVQSEQGVYLFADDHE